MTPEEAANLPFGAPVTVTLQGTSMKTNNAPRLGVWIDNGEGGYRITVHANQVERRAIPLEEHDIVRSDSPQPPVGTLVRTVDHRVWRHEGGLWGDLWRELGGGLGRACWGENSLLVGGEVLHVGEGELTDDQVRAR